MLSIHNRNGFTLIELLVALTLFTIVITIAVSTLLALIDANTKARNMQEAMTNLQFAIDSMTREIRTGTNYYCGAAVVTATPATNATRDCNEASRANALSVVEGGNSITGADIDRISYRFNSEAGRIERSITREGDVDWQPFTSDVVRVNEMYFVVRGTADLNNDGDTEQPTVTIFIAGEAGDIEGLDTSFTVQTTVTQRIRDIDSNVE